ncbi:hypothetical protein FGIG_04433 [Fasciola gigantica]|uniref:Uncharacterized protein n=1 Tax=Fasciola gigantica TaxID=46835 RepID=A0A504YFR9_FASGI|nr:hypothetical protein FGIG_04433 [Fasciola gigantica]
MKEGENQVRNSTTKLASHLASLHNMIDYGIRKEFDRMEDQMTTDWVNRLDQADGIVVFERAPFEQRRVQALTNMIKRCRENPLQEQSKTSPKNPTEESPDAQKKSNRTSVLDTELADLIDDDLISVRSDKRTHSPDTNEHTPSGTSVTNTLVTLYSRACHRRKQYARRRIKERLSYLCTDSVYDLRELDLDKKQLRPILDVIKKSHRLSKLDVSFNQICTDGLELLKPILLEAVFLNYLNVSGTGMDFHGSVILNAVLRENTPLETLIVAGRKLEKEAVRERCDLLQENTRLHKLDLSRNSIDSPGTIALCQAIRDNITLNWLSVHWNRIHLGGAVEIGNLLKVNNGLEYLDMSWNGAAFAGCESIANGLRHNHTLLELDLRANRVDLKCVIALSEFVNYNRTLKIIRLGLNPLTVAGIQQFAESLERSANCGLEVLDLEGQTLNEMIVQQFRRISLVRHFSVLNSNCVQWMPHMGKQAKQDPMSFIMNYLNKHGMRIVDLYRLIDTRRVGVLTRADFVAGILKVKIPMNPNELETLLDYVDQNNTDQISFQMLASRLYLYRVSIRDQLRTRATEFSKHHLDQSRMFVRPDGPDDLEKPPQGFPSKTTNRKKISRSLHNLTEDFQIKKREQPSLAINQSYLKPTNFSNNLNHQVKWDKVNGKTNSVAEIHVKHLAQAPPNEGSNGSLTAVPVLDIFNKKYINELTKYSG